MKTKLIVILILLCSIRYTSFSQNSKVMTANDVVLMKNAGLGDTLIMQTIAAAKQYDFSISPKEMVELKNQGITDKILSVMMQKEQMKNMLSNYKEMGIKSDQSVLNNSMPGDLNTLHYGIYIFQKSSGIFKPIIQNSFSEEQSNGFLHNNVSGLINKKSWSVLSNSEAAIRLKHTDTIYCILDKTGDNTNIVFGKVNSPNQLVLVKLDKRKNGRGISLSSYNSLSSSIGISDKDRVLFKTEEIAPGIYKIFFDELKEGEYCLMPAAAKSMAVQVYGASVYDFGIDK